MVGCVEPTDSQVYVDRPRAIQTWGTPWPEPSIPVCVSRPSDWAQAELELVRAAFYRNWGRYTGIVLNELGDCDANAERVVLQLAEDCPRELVRVPQVGYPGPGVTMPITLCRSYLDSTGRRRNVDPGLFEHAAIHAWGHVLGLRDESYASVGGTGMMQGIDIARYGELRFSRHVETVQNAYGKPPSGSLGGPSGLCVSFAHESSAASHEACDGKAERQWLPIDGRFEHVATGACLRALSGDEVALGECDGAKRWDVNGARWRGRGDRCVTVRKAPSTTQSSLMPAACSATNALPEQAWTFEFPARNRVRIRSEADGRCVRRPEPWSPWPVLGDCDGVHDLFETELGELGIGGRCLADQGSDVAFAACSGSQFQRFGWSGTLQHQGRALTTISTEAGVKLVTTASASSVDERVLFDYTF